MQSPLRNPRHEAFAQALAMGKTADAAYAEAGFRPHRGSASRLRANANIAARVAAIQSAAARVTIEAIGLTEADFIGRLLREADHYGEGSSHGARVQAVKLIGDHLGLLKQKVRQGSDDLFARAIKEISARGSAIPVATACRVQGE
jgi:hypothetical protein